MTTARKDTSAQRLIVEQLGSLQVDASTVRQWNALAGNNPFLTWEWLECWWRHYRPSRQSDQVQLNTLIVRDANGSVLGVAPWYLEDSAFDRRVVRFLGSGEVCSDYLTILCEPRHRETVVTNVVRWLTQKQDIQWELLDFDGVAHDDPALRILANQLAQVGCGVTWGDIDSCWRITLPSSWDDYLGNLSKSRRTKLRQLDRKFFETGTVQSHRVTTDADLREAFSVLCDLHQARRNSLGQAGCFASPKFLAFHQESTLRLLHSKQLTMHWLTAGKVPAAAEYSIACGDTVYFYQSGIAPEMAEMRPGWLALANAIREAIAQGYQTFDLLRGDEPYKESLGAQPRQMANLNISNTHLGARARWAVRQSALFAKNVVKRVWQTSLKA